MRILPPRRPARAVRAALHRGSLPGVEAGHLALAHAALGAIRAVDPGVIITAVAGQAGVLEIMWEGASNASHDSRIAEIADVAAGASADVCIVCGRPGAGIGPLCWWDKIARG